MGQFYPRITLESGSVLDARQHISLTEVADVTGIGRITLSRMLNRGTNVRSDTLDRLCAYFDCRIEDLVEYIPDGT